jgi:ABC-type multidrug transport system ATPase subunit
VISSFPGSLTKIDGANGSGKSTSWRSSQASIAHPAAKSPAAATGPTSPNTFLRFPFDVSGYLDRLGSLHGLTADQSRQRAAYWLDRFGAYNWIHAPMVVLSTGTAQKVALTQALMADADLLVLDEPWTGLDAEARATLDDTLQDRLTLGSAIVYVGHEHTTKNDLSADTYVIRSGSLHRVPRRLTAQSKFASTPYDHASDVIEIEFDDGRHRHVVQVTSITSDDMLRRLLAEPKHHVRSVRPVTVAAEC